jgi:hypothetical protein
MPIRAALYYAAASLGGLAVVLTAWTLGQLGVADALGVAVKPKLELPWIYRAVVWGGLWGVVFLLPLTVRPLWLKGLLFTLAPVVAALVYFIPMRGGAMFALDRGALAPLYIYLINIPWGLVTAYLGCYFVCALGGNKRG